MALVKQKDRKSDEENKYRGAKKFQARTRSSLKCEGDINLSAYTGKRQFKSIPSLIFYFFLVTRMVL